MPWFSLFVGLRYTFARKQSHLVAFISRISTMGMVLAVSLLITVMSVMNGFDKALRENILSIVPHAIISGLETTQQWRPLVELANKHPGVVNATPFSYKQALLVQQNKIKTTIMYGIDPDYEGQHSVLRKLLDDTVLQALQQEKTLVLGKKLAAKLVVNVGDTIKVIVPNAHQPHIPRFDYFSVLAFLDSGTELDERISISHRQNLALLNQQAKDSVNGIRLQVADLFASRQIAYEVAEQTQLNRLQDWSRTHGNLYQAVQMSRRLVLLLVFAIIAVAAINVVSTLVLSANDKAADIAILRTMGCSNQQIFGIFMMQGGLIGFVGMTIGIVLGLLFSMAISDSVHWLETVLNYQFLETDVYPVERLPSDIRAIDVVVVAIIAQILSVLATLFPAWQASRIQPAQILRYE